MQIGTVDSLTEHTTLTRLQAEVAVRHADGQSIEAIATELSEPESVIERAVQKTRTKAESADSLLMMLPSGFPIDHWLFPNSVKQPSTW